MDVSLPIGEPLEGEPGRRRFRIEALWDRARAWAAAGGYEYNSSYGVVGVAPT